MYKLFRLLSVMIVLTMVLSACAAAPVAAPAQPAPAATEAPSEPAAEPAATEASAAPAATEAPAEAAGADDRRRISPARSPIKCRPPATSTRLSPPASPMASASTGTCFELPGARYYWADGTWLPLYTESWEFQPPDKFVMKIRPGLTWSDGNPVTARRCGCHVQRRPPAQVDRVQVH